VLFEQLEGPSRHTGSGIRAPSRSFGLPPPTQGMHTKSSANKNWQLKATYVEVGTPHLFTVHH
jgi:kinesin family protein 4/21/27